MHSATLISPRSSCNSAICSRSISPQRMSPMGGSSPGRLPSPRCQQFPTAPMEVMAEAINSHLDLQRYKNLLISGNYSRILSRLNRNITELDVRRANTLFQFMTILELVRTPRIWWAALPSTCGRPPGRPRSCFCSPALGPHLQEMADQDSQKQRDSDLSRILSMMLANDVLAR